MLPFFFSAWFYTSIDLPSSRIASGCVKHEREKKNEVFDENDKHHDKTQRNKMKGNIIQT